jgi:hypothetical protein
MARGAARLHDGYLTPTHHYDTDDNAVSTTGEIAAVTGHTHTVHWIHCSYDGDPTGYVQIKDDTTVVWKMAITTPGPHVFKFPNGGFSVTQGNPLTVELGAGGTGVTGFLAVRTT